jgi:peptidoglycan/xylan/chitin deacetylase (PgdA/CDA1 family)
MIRLLAVNHHYYRESGAGRGIYPITPKGLAEEVTAIRRAGWRVGNESDIIKFISGELGADDKVVIITFDDGLREQLSALKQLEQLDASAICYVPTGIIVDHGVLEVHKLQMIRAQVADEEIARALDTRFDFSHQIFDDDLLAIQYRYDNQLARRIKYFLNFVIDAQEKINWTSEYFESLFGDERAVAQKLYMDKSEIECLSKKRLLGSHGHSHLPLATLSQVEILKELQTASDILKDITGAQTVGMSYPFGSKSAVSETVFSLSSQVGYEYGWTMERGINYMGDAFNKLALKRIDVNDLAQWLVEDTSAQLGIVQS